MRKQEFMIQARVPLQFTIQHTRGSTHTHTSTRKANINGAPDKDQRQCGTLWGSHLVCKCKQATILCYADKLP